MQRGITKTALLCTSAASLFFCAGVTRADEPAPIMTMDRATLDIVTSLPEALRLVPETQDGQDEFSGNGQEGSNQSGLRSLGAQRTLTLIDGRRYGVQDAPNLNLIPSEALERVDVYGAGGGTWFGPNAMGGVVNLVIKAPDHGLEVIAKGGFAAHENDNSEARAALAAAGDADPRGFRTDAAVWSLTAIGGARLLDDHLRASFYLSYRRAEPLYASQRDYQACPYRPSDTTDAHVCDGSFVGAPGFIVPLIGPNSFESFSPTSARGFVPYDGALYNYAPPNTIRQESSRYSVGGSFDYHLSNRATLYGETQLMVDDERHQIAPDGIFPFFPFGINCDNPLMSASQSNVLGCGFVGPTDDVPVLIARRNAEGSPRRFADRHTVGRFVAGLKGQLSPIWSYDVSAQYSRVAMDLNERGELSLTRIQEALQVVNVSGTPTCKSVVDHSDPACVPYDIFSPTGSTAAARRFLETQQTGHDNYNEWLLSAAIRGDLTSAGVRSPWAAHGLGVEAGVDYRRLDERFRPGAFDAIGDITGAPVLPLDGTFDVASFKLDLALPLVEGRPGLHRLQAGGTYRISDDSHAGSYWIGKADLTWSPIERLSFWAGIERTAREPSVAERFGGVLQTFAFATDPCAGPLSTAQATKCRGAFPSTDPSLFGSIPDFFCCATTIGGNASLKPEIADITTLGGDFAPPALDGLDLRFEAYDIRNRGQVSTPDAPGVLSGCIDLGIHADCALVHRDPIDGSLIDGAGFIDLTQQNFATSHVRGFDLGGTYHRPLRIGSRDGTLGVVFRGAYLDRMDLTLMQGEAPFHCAGLYSPCGQSAPRWRHNLTVSWSPTDNPWSVEARWRHVGSMMSATMSSDPRNSCFCHDTADISIRDYNVFDLSASLNLTRRIRLGVSVDNVFDTDPPTVSNSIVSLGSPFSNTFPALYDSLGRTVLFTLDARY